MKLLTLPELPPNMVGCMAYEAMPTLRNCGEVIGTRGLCHWPSRPSGNSFGAGTYLPVGSRLTPVQFQDGEQTAEGT